MTVSAVPLSAFLKFRFLFSFNTFNDVGSLSEKLCFGLDIFI